MVVGRRQVHREAGRELEGDYSCLHRPLYHHPHHLHQPRDRHRRDQHYPRLVETEPSWDLDSAALAPFSSAAPGPVAMTERKHYPKQQKPSSFEVVLAVHPIGLVPFAALERSVAVGLLTHSYHRPLLRPHQLVL